MPLPNLYAYWIVWVIQKQKPLTTNSPVYWLELRLTTVIIESTMADNKGNELSRGEASLMLNDQTVISPVIEEPRNRRPNLLCVCLVIFVLLFLCMTALYIVERHRKVDKSHPQTSTSKKSDICKTAECFETASGQ